MVSWGLRDAQKLAWRWRLAYASLLEDRLAFGKHRVMIERYEDVVADPNGFRERVARFLDTSPAFTALDSSGDLFGADETWKRRAVEAPDPSRIGAWRTSIDAQDAGVIEAITASLAEGLGYVRSEQGARSFTIDPRTYLDEVRRHARHRRTARLGTG